MDPFIFAYELGTKHKIHQNQPVGFSNAQSTAFPSALFWAGIVPSSSYPSTQETEVHGPG